MCYYYDTAQSSVSQWFGALANVANCIERMFNLTLT